MLSLAPLNYALPLCISKSNPNAHFSSSLLHSSYLHRFDFFGKTDLRISMNGYERRDQYKYQRTKPGSIEDRAQEKEEEEEYRVLTFTRTEYNNILILESREAKLLILDDTRNIHSLMYKGQQWTNSYWDEFASLPSIVPQGPIALFGLGGGTSAHILLHFWPNLELHGWELDNVLVDKAREFFGLSELEMVNDSGGVLRVHVGDALSSLASVDGGYAGIVVDLFSSGKVLTQLEKAVTWSEMSKKLMPNGRIMVNCGGVDCRMESLSDDRMWERNFVIKALCESLGERSVNWKKMPENESGNYLALTGALPDSNSWSVAVPDKLSSAVQQWRPCSPFL